MSEQTMVEQISVPEKLTADFKVPSGNAFHVPHAERRF
jgi:hypothetical protein